uniref:VWFD domain-containing protein n=1 Tax=Mastacembelus armatus TaxID=205130 RepID=A0A3Q3M7C1_9TELE
MVIDLQPYESVQLQSPHDLSGTRVTSQRPVAVFTGHSCTWQFSKCNFVFEQLLPVSGWGSSFIVPPLSIQTKYDSVFLQASQPTKVTVQYPSRQDVLSLTGGQFKELQYHSPETLSIQADQGIQVLLFFNGVTLNKDKYYDSFLMTILSTDRYCSSYSIEALQDFENQILIVAQTSAIAELRIDGVNLPATVQWKKVTGTDFSWVPGLIEDALCRDDCVGGCERCENSLMNIWAGDSFCGLITLTINGPFSKCHAAIDPQAYLENCKYDVCMGGGLRHFLCKALEAYTEHLLQSVLRFLPQAPKCPANSHYELCGSSCPATCSDPTAPSKCKRPCVETCTCNAGFLLSGNQCVPDTQCGCTHEGRYVPAGESRVECQDKTCGAGQQCQVVEGIRKCKAVSHSTCQATGDPHYKTFDKQKFDFQGTCVYQLVALCSKNKELVPFECCVLSRRVSVYLSGMFAVVTTEFGLKLSFNWESAAFVTLPSTYMEATCGLCGNFNGNPKDDFTTPSGTQADGLVAFASSWKVPGLIEDALCRDDCVGGCERCENSLMNIWAGDSFCGLITLTINGPFSKCHAAIDPQAYLENCKYDVCMGGGLRHFLCKALEAYTEACQLAEIQIEDWRTIAQCRKYCTKHCIHYELCGSSCPATCSDPTAPSKCKRPCVETCTCNAGFLLSGNQCVPDTQCGCTHEGRYVPAGESFWADQGCQRWCKCVAGSRRVECQDKTCGAGQQCQVVEGIRKCKAASHSTCQATGDPHYKTFDKQKFDFQGTCVYQLVALCSKNKELVPFEVLVQNDHRGSKVVSYTKLVEIKVYSLSIVITKTYKDFGLKLSFNWESAAFVTLPSTYMEAVCGLCGNYNGKPQDDLIPKNGDKPVSPADFGDSWQVAEIPGCVRGCEGVCPSCDTRKKAQYETGDFCGILTDPKGPFRDCHAKVDPAGFFEDCVYDVCMYNGKKDVLCQAITAYTSTAAPSVCARHLG